MNLVVVSWACKTRSETRRYSLSTSSDHYWCGWARRHLPDSIREFLDGHDEGLVWLCLKLFIIDGYDDSSDGFHKFFRSHFNLGLLREGHFFLYLYVLSLGHGRKHTELQQTDSIDCLLDLLKDIQHRRSILSVENFDEIFHAACHSINLRIVYHAEADEASGYGKEIIRRKCNQRNNQLTQSDGESAKEASHCNKPTDAYLLYVLCELSKGFSEGNKPFEEETDDWSHGIPQDLDLQAHQAESNENHRGTSNESWPSE